MPYAEDGSDVPEAIKKLPAKRRRQFAKVWNSVYEETADEGRAFAAANAAIKEEEKMAQAMEGLAQSPNPTVAKAAQEWLAR